MAGHRAKGGWLERSFDAYRLSLSLPHQRAFAGETRICAARERWLFSGRPPVRPGKWPLRLRRRRASPSTKNQILDADAQRASRISRDALRRFEWQPYNRPPRKSRRAGKFGQRRRPLGNRDIL